MVSNWLLKEFARARWSPRYLGIPIGKEVWGYLSDTERKPENSIPLKNPKNTASSTERACWLPKTMWRSTTRLTWSRNQKSISMITGVAPPDRFDKLESISLHLAQPVPDPASRQWRRDSSSLLLRPSVLRILA